MNFVIGKNGTVDITAAQVALRGGYPEVDGTPVRPLRVEVSENRARYELENGAITLTFSCTPDEDGKDEIVITAETEGLAGIHDISILGNLRPENCMKAFYQCFGMGGPSGFTKLGPDASFESEAVVAAGSDEECIAFFVPDQSRFRSRYFCDRGVLRAVIDAEGTLAEKEVLPAFHVRAAENFDSALRHASGEIAERMNARPLRVKEPVAFHWCSWYYLYHTLDQVTLESYLEGFGKHRDRFPFSHIQIDAGYFPSCGDWLETFYRFPEGLKHAADTIKAAGWEPGIWIGPFMVGDESKIAKEHPDWLLKYRDGSPVLPWKNYNEPKPWGYRDSHYFVLDTSHPEAFAYIRNVFRTLRSWGFTLFKTDFLLWGIQDSSKVLRHTPGKTSFEYFREFMAMVREEIGDARWLGCIAPFMPSIGFVDMMRIAGDVGAQWEENNFGPINMLQELTADQYFNNVYWQNDPDAIMIRDFHIHIKEPQISALAILEAMSGSAVYTSDPVHLIGESRRKLLEFIRPKDIVRAEFPHWQKMDDLTLIVNHLPQGSVIYWFNATSQEKYALPDWKTLTADGETCLLEWSGTGEVMLSGSDAAQCGGTTASTPAIRIAPRSGRLFFATKEPLKEQPENLWNWE